MLLTAYNEDQSTGSWVRLMLLLHLAGVGSAKGVWEWGGGAYLPADREPEHLSWTLL